MKNKLIGSMMVVLVLTALTATSVFAQVSLPSSSNTNNNVVAPPPSNGFKLNDEALQAAAGVLGITVDELSTALEAGTTLEELATTASVDVQDVFEAIRAVMPGPGDGFGGPKNPGNLKLSDEALQAAADALGITFDELSAALDAGTTLEEFATTAGVDIQTVKDAIKTAMPAPDSQPGAPGQMQLNDEALQAAADALGITVDELSAALDAGTTLEELATTAGVDYQTVMDAIKAVMPAPNGGQSGALGQMQLNDEALQVAADALGITVDELSAALDAGTTLDELAATAGVDIQTVMDAIKTAMPAPSDQPGGMQPGQSQSGTSGQVPTGQPSQGAGGPPPGQFPGGQPPSSQP